MIELKANASSPEEAKKIAEVSISELAKRQLELATPIISKMQHDLLIAKERLVNVERELEAIRKLVINAGVKDERFTQLSLMTDLRVQKEAEIFQQRQSILSLETAMGWPYTQPAGPIEAIFVTDRPVSPKKAMLLVFGLIGGLLAGVVFVVFVGAWRRVKGG